MALIKSISGIRGTIGGLPDTNLTPPDIVRFVSAYAEWLRKQSSQKQLLVMVGRDARVSGPMVQSLVIGTLLSMGVDVTDLDLATTPTVEIAVINAHANGGIIITASHNPGEWNALKLLNGLGEFLSASDGKEVMKLAGSGKIKYQLAENLGVSTRSGIYNQIHIKQVVEHPMVDRELIKKANFTVAVDCVNSVGSVILPELLQELGVKNIKTVNCTPNGLFPRNPEPVPDNLQPTLKQFKKFKADVGFVVDPDVDRLVIINENGTFFGEEYTLVAIADYILGQIPGNVVSNLSSSRALSDVAEKYGFKRFVSAVGEVNVVDVMKQKQAVIGGEGNGGVILPDLHYGRDALIGIALFLTHLAKEGLKCSELRARYPEYHIVKKKLKLTGQLNFKEVYDVLKSKYYDFSSNEEDGLYLFKDKKWIHIRQSNTEPIMRIIAETPEEDETARLVEETIKYISQILK